MARLLKGQEAAMTFVEWEKKAEEVKEVNSWVPEDGISKYKKVQRLERSLNM